MFACNIFTCTHNIIYEILKFDLSNFKLLVSNSHDISWIHRLNSHQSLENIASHCFLLTSDNIHYVASIFDFYAFTYYL